MDDLSAVPAVTNIRAPVAETVDDSHLPDRPSWLCRRCKQPWPCETSRQDLWSEFVGARTALSVYLSIQYEDACGDLAGVPTGDLYSRFILWIRDRY